MPQIFHPATNTFSRVTIFGAVFALGALAWIAGAVQRSPYVTEAYVARAQPVPFSHRHHVGGVGIDCRYCHTTVDKSAFAGIPPTQTCMNCHAQLWVNSPTLEPVRASWRSDRSLAWTRVHDLPDFVYFNHSIHVQKGVGCATCHGRIDRMPLTWREHTLAMEWCLECHRHPERFVRPREEVFSMEWTTDDQDALGRRLVAEYGIAPPARLTSCSTCHR
jgi:hypothetical protein